MTRSVFTYLSAAMVMLMLATSASAECAWVLWSRLTVGSQRERALEWTNGERGGEAYSTRAECQDRIASVTRLPRPGSVGDWLDWLRSAGPYDPKRSVAPQEFKGSSWSSDGSAMTITPTALTEWKCLPENMDPRGPKGK